MRLRTPWPLIALSLAIGWMVPVLHAQAPKPVVQSAPAQVAAVPDVPAFDLSALDRTADPCNDFYQFACGGWVARNPPRPDQPRWSRFHALMDRNLETLRRLAEQAASSPGTPGSDRWKVGTYYAACTDESAIESKGLGPLDVALAPIRALSAPDGLADAFASLTRLGIAAPFRLSADQDFKNSSAVIATADQGGLGLPDRDYYLRDGQNAVDLRQQYVGHIERMFVLLGHPAADAHQEAEAVMAMETALARGALGRVDRRDPAMLYHVMTVQDLVALAPGFAWPRYFQKVGVGALRDLNVAVPGFFKALGALVKERSAADWRNYLAWHVLRTSAPALPLAFQEENFAFYGKTLTGATARPPRWRQCVESADRQLGDALGRLFVDETFGADGKARALALVGALKKALGRDIEELPWMSAQTRREAQVKLAAIAEKIGYPDRWRDYSRLEIARGDALGNRLRASAFEAARQLAKIGRPLDRGEWLISPPTVDAYYDPQLNQITFPAGILQPPFFDRQKDEAVNFGGIGTVIGHELTHGFDDEGRRFDASGNLRDWWTPEDVRGFNDRAACVVNQYGGYTAVADVKLNGKLTLGENIADNGGVRIALMALLDTLAGSRTEPIDGFTPEQRLFVSYAQIWCQNQTDEVARLLATTDPHSPSRYRVNGVVANMPEFHKAFSCTADVPAPRERMCRVW